MHVRANKQLTGSYGSVVTGQEFEICDEETATVLLSRGWVEEVEFSQHSIANLLETDANDQVLDTDSDDLESKDKTEDKT